MINRVEILCAELVAEHRVLIGDKRAFGFCPFLLVEDIRHQALTAERSEIAKQQCRAGDQLCIDLHWLAEWSIRITR